MTRPRSILFQRVAVVSGLLGLAYLALADRCSGPPPSGVPWETTAAEPNTSPLTCSPGATPVTVTLPQQKEKIQVCMEGRPR